VVLWIQIISELLFGFEQVKLGCGKKDIDKQDIDEYELLL